MRLIDADDAAKWASEHILDATERYYILDFLRDCATIDAVEVVRCKDCKYADTKRKNAVEKRYISSVLFCRNSDICGNEPLAMLPDDFCSYGERSCNE